MSGHSCSLLLIPLRPHACLAAIGNDAIEMLMWRAAPLGGDMLNGWTDPGDVALTGDFLGYGHTISCS